MLCLRSTRSLLRACSRRRGVRTMSELVARVQPCYSVHGRNQHGRDAGTYPAIFSIEACKASWGRHGMSFMLAYLLLLTIALPHRVRRRTHLMMVLQPHDSTWRASQGDMGWCRQGERRSYARDENEDQPSESTSLLSTDPPSTTTQSETTKTCSESLQPRQRAL